MNKIDFDNYSEKYDQLMAKQHEKFGDINYYNKYKVEIVKRFFSDRPSNVLEFGCGIGRNLKYFETLFNKINIFASDISEESLEKVRNLSLNINIIKDEELVEFKEYFDLIFISGVYHHIQPNYRINITKKLFDLLKKDGTIIIFEHNPYNPLTRHMVNTCEFDEDAVLMKKSEIIKLFEDNGFYCIKSEYTLFVPPKLSKLNFIEKYISWLPLGGQYFAIFKKI